MSLDYEFKDDGAQKTIHPYVDWIETQTVWLPRSHIAVLLDIPHDKIEAEIEKIYEELKLSRTETHRIMWYHDTVNPALAPVRYPAYNLHVISALAYRSNSIQGVAFLEWARERLQVGLKVDVEELRNAFPPFTDRPGWLRAFDAAKLALIGRRRRPPSPLMEELSTEVAQRGLSIESGRRLELHGGPQPIWAIDSRHNFHVVKDSESAYVIQKTKEFIAEAMFRLEVRGRRFYLIAFCNFALAVLVLAGGIALTWNRLHEQTALSSAVPGQVITAEIPYRFTLALIGTLGLTGLLLIIVKMLLAFAKAAMHEAVKHFERRHAMRFGWLYMELRGRDWNFEELKEALQWNREATSAFRDLDLKHISDTTLNALLARLNDMTQKAESKASEKIGEGIGSGKPPA